MISSWSEVWFQVAFAVAQRSKCDRAQVGAVIVDNKMRVIATGYNGPAAGYKAESGCLNWCERAKGSTSLTGAYDGCPSIHAEANALLYVDRSKTEGATMFITHPPCFSCAKLISNSGIISVLAVERETDSHREPNKVYEYLKTCGIQAGSIKEEEWLKQLSTIQQRGVNPVKSLDQ